MGNVATKNHNVIDISFYDGGLCPLPQAICLLYIRYGIRHEFTNSLARFSQLYARLYTFC